MGNGRVSIERLDELIQSITLAYEERVDEDAEEWQSRRDHLIQDVRSLYDDRQNAGPLLASLLDTVLLADVLWYAGRVGDLQDDLEAERNSALRLEAEIIALQEEIARLKMALARCPQAVTVHIPAQRISLRSPIQQEIVRLMGAEGLGRSWRIIARVAGAGLAQENSVRNALRKLTKRGVIDDYRRHDRPVRWKVTAGGNRRLVVLTEMGQAWYREAFGRETVESEIVAAARLHCSAAHGVGVLEVRDHLRAAGFLVDDSPDAILAGAEEQWGSRMEPDLLVVQDGRAWPVEVQREVSERLLTKWGKALSLAGRLILVLFNEQRRSKQEAILERAVWYGGLPKGEIRMTSLEAMEAGNWEWKTI